MTAGEIIGYATITKPEAEEIQKLMDRENELSYKVEQLQSELIDKQARIDKMTAEIDQLQEKFDALKADKQKYEKGQALATDLLAMKPQQAVATLTEAEDTLLEFFVAYAMPFMRKTPQHKKFMDTVAKNNPVLAAQIEALVAKEEERIAQ
ncbi:MAG: hypothetical protein O7E52_26145 [Candidatus Poribacteria bacterium]|nr:hypothetical protein [Candidatus Poribacteria bacterium]